MGTLNRREAFKAAGAASVAAALGTGVASAQGARGPRNQEPPVASQASADSHGPRELFAVVDAEGNLRRGLHATSVTRLEIGLYEVVFARDVRRGVYVATVGGHGYSGLPPTGQASVMGRATNPRAVVVSTVDSQGDPVNLGFHLLVVCPEGFA